LEEAFNQGGEYVCYNTHLREEIRRTREKDKEEGGIIFFGEWGNNKGNGQDSKVRNDLGTHGGGGVGRGRKEGNGKNTNKKCSGFKHCTKIGLIMGNSLEKKCKKNLEGGLKEVVPGDWGEGGLWWGGKDIWRIKMSRPALKQKGMFVLKTH